MKSMSVVHSINKMNMFVCFFSCFSNCKVGVFQLDPLFHLMSRRYNLFPKGMIYKPWIPKRVFFLGKDSHHIGERRRGWTLARKNLWITFLLHCTKTRILWKLIVFCYQKILALCIFWTIFEDSVKNILLT